MTAAQAKNKITKNAHKHIYKTAHTQQQKPLWNLQHKHVNAYIHTNIWKFNLIICTSP